MCLINNNGVAQHIKVHFMQHTILQPGERALYALLQNLNFTSLGSHLFPKERISVRAHILIEQKSSPISVCCKNNATAASFLRRRGSKWGKSFQQTLQISHRQESAVA